MDLLTTKVVIAEENQTRADLYSLWLDDCDVRVALTESQATEELDRSVGVAIINEDFGGGAAGSLLGDIRERDSVCNVIATRDRSAAFSALDVEHQFVKPVFEAELVDTVERLLYRANYQLALRLYYPITVELSPAAVNADEREVDPDQQAHLEEQADRLKRLIAGLAQNLTEEDMVAIRRSVTIDTDIEATKSEEKISSKYCPPECSGCGIGWDQSSRGTDRSVSQLGAHVWRCTECGHVQMSTDPSHQDVGTYRR